LYNSFILVLLQLCGPLYRKHHVKHASDDLVNVTGILRIPFFAEKLPRVQNEKSTGLTSELHGTSISSVTWELMNGELLYLV